MIPLRIEKLQRSHAIDAFDCGREALNQFLIRHALQNQQAEASQTYLALLARPAVATSWQGKGLGAGLLKDAMLRTLQAADIAGIRAFAVHAKDDAARAFYEHFDFAPSPADPYHLFCLLKDLRKLLKT